MRVATGQTSNFRLLSKRSLLLAALLTLLAGCGVVVEKDRAPVRAGRDDTPDAVPREEPRSRYGNPESYVVYGKRYYTLKTSHGFKQKGVASWYGKKFHGRRTSSGETYDMYQMTAAHKTLPLPTYVEVINLENNLRTVVKVNDRGPFHDNRIIDLSYAAARKLGVVEKGTAMVQVRAVSSPGELSKTRSASTSSKQDASIYLQIGAFSDRDNAERLRRQVAKVLKQSVRISSADVSNRSVYRVQVGPIANVGGADRVVQVLADIGVYDHHFVSN